MLGLSLYSAAFYVVSIFLFLFASIKSLVRGWRMLDVNRAIEFFVVCLAISVASYDISNRPSDVPGDTAVYINFFNDFTSGLENPFQTFEPGFIHLVKLFGYLGFDHHAFFYCITFAFLWSYYFLIKAVFGRDSSWVLFVFGAVLYYPFFFSLSANVVRQCLALCFINIALCFIIKGRRGGSVLSSLFAVLFHKSSIVYFPFFVVQRLVLKSGVLGVVVLWVAVSLASYFKLFSLLVSVLFAVLSAYGLVINYSEAEGIDYLTGFRLDFWAFSSISIMLIVTLKLLGGELHKREAYIFYICAFLSCLHIAMFDVAYNDRFGIYSWIFYPLELAYVMRAVSKNFYEGKLRNKGISPVAVQRREV